MKIVVNDIRLLCEILLTKGEKNQGSIIELCIDDYWDVDFDEAYNTTKDPELSVGSLLDDYDWLEKVLSKEHSSTTLDFDRLGNIIKIIGDQFYMPMHKMDESIKLKISINDIRHLCESILKKAVKAGFKKLDISFDKYWYIDLNEAYDFTKKPKIVMGSLVSNWKNLKKALLNQQQPTHNDFQSLGRMVKIVGEVIDHDLELERGINWLMLSND